MIRLDFLPNLIPHPEQQSMCEHLADITRDCPECTAAAAAKVMDSLAPAAPSPKPRKKVDKLRVDTPGAAAAPAAAPAPEPAPADPILKLLVPVDEPPGLEAIDGYLVDAAGEIIGLADPEGRPNPFVIDDASKADWALEKMAREDAAVLAVEARRAAVNANLDAEAKVHQARRKYLSWRFDGELTSVARKILEGGKSKTCRFTFGQVAFRMGSTSNAITDMSRAVTIAKEWAPQAVKTVESVNVTDLLKLRAGFERELAHPPAKSRPDLDRDLIAAALNDLDAVIESTTTGEKVKITTGVGE
jgi:phage host-nuclease inhibitor protein Gam